jgi:hypothetical protein
MLVDAEEVSSGVVEVGRDLTGGGVDGSDDLAAVGGDETDGVGGVVDHDGDHDAGLCGWWAIKDPGAAYFLDTVVEGDAAIVAMAHEPSEDGGVEGGRDVGVDGGDFEVADLSVAEGGRHDNSFLIEFTASWGEAAGERVN